MNKVFRKLVNLPIMAVICSVALLPVSALAEIDEFNGPSAEQMRVDEVKNEVVLLQRLDQRTLKTSLGTVVVPPMVTMVDERQPDDWYSTTPARVTFYYTNDLDMKRVVISE